MTDDRRRMPSYGKSSHCLWQGELKWYCWYDGLCANLECGRSLVWPLAQYKGITGITVSVLF